MVIRTGLLPDEVFLSCTCERQLNDLKSNNCVLGIYSSTAIVLRGFFRVTPFTRQWERGRPDTLKGRNRFRWLKKSDFFSCHKLLVKLSKNMFPKFQWKISIRSGVTIVFKWMYFMHFSRNDFFENSVHCSSKSFRSIILIISRYFLYIITLYLNLNP